MNVLGLDPGVSGGIACLGEYPAGTGSFMKLKDATERDIYDFLVSFEGTYAFIEKVGATPQMGVVSAFTFGRGYGLLRGLLIACRIPFEEVSPRVWQKEMGCLSGGDKRVTKARAQQLFPHVKCNHYISDALLLCEYGRRTLAQRNGATP